MKLFFARHGESEANLLRVMSNRNVNHHLTDAGREQALKLAQTLASEGVEHVYASPICRARETGEIVAGELGVPLTLCDGLREFHCGVLEGRGDEEAWAQHLWVQNQWFHHDDPNARIEGGESFADIEKRFRAMLATTLSAHTDSQAVLYVSHGATLGAMMPLVLENLTQERLWELGLKYTTIIEVVQNQDLLICVRWNGVAV